MKHSAKTHRNYQTGFGTGPHPAPIPKEYCNPMQATLTDFRNATPGSLNNRSLRRAFALACQRIDELEKRFIP